ncbi:Wzz/FepE/Etk N-terminal domain-containing protein [Mariprofundus sp. KV]|uniref:Wzz/FepE/Etk N-terminal domain-containing protein n=1 Tax=Mariprofundus sp. KV TaxID=2608715 RepID=UPI0015A3486C|nr:Wzz/FepE/Etk N-terminal domain-containing protein [Mariprofundus sp. KV]NWF35562.1 hypothetical protein [Mariprofundus sp. KV]
MEPSTKDQPQLQSQFGGLPQESEIDFEKYAKLLWSHKWLILTVMVVVGIISALYAKSMPNIYRAEVLLAQVDDQSGGGGGRMSSFLGKFGGLASMAGISIPQGDMNQSLAMLESREFLWKFYQDEKLRDNLFTKLDKEGNPRPDPTVWQVYRRLSAIIDVNEDKMTGLIALSVTHQDPEFAARLANALASRLNDYVRLQEVTNTSANLTYLNKELRNTKVDEMRLVLFDLIRKEQQKLMLLNTRKQYVFKVIDAAITPDVKVAPKRLKIVLGAILISGLLISLLLLGREKLRETREVAKANI